MVCFKAVRGKSNKICPEPKIDNSNNTKNADNVIGISIRLHMKVAEGNGKATNVNLTEDLQDMSADEESHVLQSRLLEDQRKMESDDKSLVDDSDHNEELHLENEDLWIDEEWEEILQCLQQSITEAEKSDDSEPVKNTTCGLTQNEETELSETKTDLEYQTLREELENVKAENIKYRQSLSKVKAEKSILLEKVEKVIDERIEDVIRVRQDYKNKIKRLEGRKKVKEGKLRRQYEKRLREITNSNENLAARCDSVLSGRSRTSPLSMMCDNEEDQKEFEESLQRLQELLRSKSLDYETLEAKYEEQERLVDFLSTSLQYENAEENATNQNVLRVLKDLENSVEDLRQENLNRSTKSINELPIHENVSNFDKGLNSTWPLQSNEIPERAPFETAWRGPSNSNKIQADLGDPEEIDQHLNPKINKWTSVDILDGIPGNNVSGNLSVDSGVHSSSIKSSPIKATKIKQAQAKKRELPPVSSITYCSSYKTALQDNRKEHDTLLENQPPVPISRETSRNSAMSRDSGLFEDEFISHQNILHNINEMLKKLEEKHEEMKRDELHDKIWSWDLDMWKHRTYYRINALRVIFGIENMPCRTSLYDRVLYRPDDYETYDIVQRTPSEST